LIRHNTHTHGTRSETFWAVPSWAASLTR
jgi:hypothetical protein